MTFYHILPILGWIKLHIFMQMYGNFNVIVVMSLRDFPYHFLHEVWGPVSYHDLCDTIGHGNLRCLKILRDYENPLVSLNKALLYRAGYFLGVNVVLGGVP